MSAELSEPILDIALRLASDFSLPPNLVTAIIRTESGGNPWAFRYEPAFFDRYIANKRWPVFGAISQETEKRGRATSWGLMQVMGQTARELGCVEPYISSLCWPETGIYWGCRYLERLVHLNHSKYGWKGVVWSYNQGPGAPTGRSGNDYLDKVSRNGAGVV